jgi:hypothetical protein
LGGLGTGNREPLFPGKHPRKASVKVKRNEM